jgi:hypothetical protein
MKKLKADKRTLIRILKDRPCADCGQRFPPAAMDFDHVRGEKLHGVAHIVNTAHSIDTLLAEIAKCDVVCATCHRIRTHQEAHEDGR